MHEMSLAINIVELCVARAEEAGARRISSIALEVGELAGVMVEALTFCFTAASQGTLAEGAELSVAQPKGRARCLACELEFAADSLVCPCPKCGGYASELLQGRELRVASLVVDEE